MATAKKSSTTAKSSSNAAPKTTDARLNDIEKRLAALEADKCEFSAKVKKCWDECKVPSQSEARAWIKANPFLALAIAVLGTALIVSIIS